MAAGEGFATNSANEVHYCSNKIINFRFDKFRKNGSNYNLKELETEQKFIENRLGMLYKQLEVKASRIVIWQKLKIRPNFCEDSSFRFKPKNSDDFEVFRQLIFSLADKYKIDVCNFENHYPLSMFQAVSSISYMIREIALLETEKVLVESFLAEKSAGSTPKQGSAHRKQPIKPIHNMAMGKAPPIVRALRS